MEYTNPLETVSSYQDLLDMHGHFEATKGGLKKVQEKPIKVVINGKKYTVKSDNPFYSAISYYGKVL